MMPEVDLSSGGWTVWVGQAVWRRGADLPTLAGDVVLARHRNGDVLVNFSKPPLSIFTARTAGDRWTIEFVDGGGARAGRGSPPRRFVWFYLPRVLAGEPAPGKWQSRVQDDVRWTFHDPRSDETIKLVIDR
jgi:hypothetical protein